MFDHHGQPRPTPTSSRRQPWRGHLSSGTARTLDGGSPGAGIAFHIQVEVDGEPSSSTSIIGLRHLRQQISGATILGDLECSRRATSARVGRRSRMLAWSSSSHVSAPSVNNDMHESSIDRPPAALTMTRVEIKHSSRSQYPEGGKGECKRWWSEMSGSGWSRRAAGRRAMMTMTRMMPGLLVDDDDGKTLPPV